MTAPPATDVTVPLRDSVDVATLYIRYRPLVFGVALRLLADPDAADDAVQDIFLKLWQQPTLFDPTHGAFDRWVSRVTRNYCLSRVRVASRVVGFDGIDIVDSRSRMEEVEHQVWLLPYRVRLNDALTLLTPMQRRVLNLVYGDGFSHSQIVAVTGLSLGMVKWRIRDSQRVLRVALADLADSFGL